MSETVLDPPVAPAHAPAGAGAPLPGPRMPRPLQGMRMLLTEHDMLERYRRRYGDVFAIQVWPFSPLVVVSDPAEVKRIFTGDATQLHAGEGNRVLEPLVGRHSVLLLDEAEHLQRRKLMLPAFHGERMRVYGELMREIAEEEIDSWPVGEPFGLSAGMQRITLRVILRAVFGLEEGAGMERLQDRLMTMMNRGAWAMMIPFAQHDFGPRSPWGRFLAARRAVDALLYAEIARRRADPATPERTDVLSMLLQARDGEGHGLSDAELRDDLVTLLLAGHETTATTMAWAFERLVRHPAVLGRLRDELASGEEGYLDGVIKETQRTRPVLTYVMRQLTAPMEVGGYRVPAGATLGSSITLIHRRPDLYADPAAFRPERYAERPTETYTWIPFGGGVRRCLGAAFATYEMRIVLRAVVERCALRAAETRPERPRRRSITFVPSRGARVVIGERTAA